MTSPPITSCFVIYFLSYHWQNTPKYRCSFLLQQHICWRVLPITDWRLSMLVANSSHGMLINCFQLRFDICFSFKVYICVYSSGTADLRSMQNSKSALYLQCKNFTDMIVVSCFILLLLGMCVLHKCYNFSSSGWFQNCLVLQTSAQFLISTCTLNLLIVGLILNTCILYFN